ncbi:MAG TPA: ABC transporter ATP-binding protein, partial [Candidatus Hydrogenedentes bacterium]|nr:ABC transporter ATP-binding protein [Candidatus Hydrogenedentota bacterium]HOH50709.1 ABC transporter ATP-binding protein [Candidatus Hydrogenedentota bacterium]
MAAIEVQHVSKSFPARRGARDLRGRGGLRDWILGRKSETFEALKDITFSVEQGETLGIIGRNGSGKSTLLSILAGVTLPSGGSVTVRGRIASLLELGAGFHPILTGRENIYLNAGLLGMRHAQTDAVYDEIVRFSGIGDFIDQPVETYSSGMYVRIGFSVAVHANPDIFLVDEVLSVGDEEFQRQCRRKIGELREQGKTIVFVSHDLGIVNTLCERVVLLSGGRMLDRGSTQKTINYYLRQVGAEKGIHNFSGGETEVTLCEGRVSVYHRGEELSAS